jgi:hypothetical protein
MARHTSGFALKASYSFLLNNDNSVSFSTDGIAVFISEGPEKMSQRQEDRRRRQREGVVSFYANQGEAFQRLTCTYLQEGFRVVIKYPIVMVEIYNQVHCLFQERR